MNKPASIAFLCHPYHRGGVTRWMADAAIALAKRGYPVYFVTPEPVPDFHSGKGREKMVQLLAGAPSRLQVVSRPVNYLYEFGTPEYRAKVCADMIRAQVPAGTPIIVSDDAAIWQAAALVAADYPMIGVIHGNDPVYYTNASNYASQLSLCICVSGRLKKNLITNCPNVSKDKIRVIPCGINLPSFAPDYRSDSVLKLIFIGRIEDKVKRATDLVKIAAALHKRSIAFHMDIVGNSKASESEYAAYFRDEGVDRFVTFHGWMAKPGIQSLLNAADVLLLTSDSEGMPLVMMEALAAGCGFTGTRVSGIEDYEYHPLAADCFGVYTTGDIDDAVTKILKVAAVPSNIRNRSARQLAEEEFAMDVCLDKYLGALSEMKNDTIKAISINQSPLYSNAIAFARYMKVKMMKG